MAKPFNLTAQLNVTGPVGLRPVVNSIKKQLSGISTNVSVKLDPSAQRGVRNLNKDIIQLNRSLKSAAGHASSLSASMSKLGGSLKTVKSASSASAKGLSSVGVSAQQTGKQLAVARTEMEEFGRISGLALRRYAGFTIATTITFGFTRAVGNAIGEALKFERELVKISQVTGKTMTNLKGLTTEIGRLSTTLGVSSSELLEVSRILSQTGLNANQVKTALSALAKSNLAPTFKDMKSTAEGAIAAMSQFGLKAKDLDSVLGSLNAVASKFAVESEDLISVIRRTGGVFKAAAGDIGAPKRQLNELAAIFTSVRSTTRESAESIATGLRTIFTRIQRPRSIQFLKELGVTVQDLSGKFVGPFEALNRLSAALKTLDPRDVRFAKIVEELGGFRQVGKLIPAIQQFGKAQQVLKVAMQGQDSLAKDAAAAQQSLLVQATKVREEFNKLFRTIASSTSFRAFSKSALQLASSLIKVTEALTPVLPALTALGTIKAVGAIRGFGAGFFGGIRQGGGATGAGAGVAGAITGQGGQRAAVASQALSVAQKAQTVATQANTKALIALSTAVNRLASRPFGGPRRGFATGGLVPGTGNYDSVPADLTPGEFVIRKSSVGRLGLDNLQRMNRMASGGRVTKSRNHYGTKAISAEELFRRMKAAGREPASFGLKAQKFTTEHATKNPKIAAVAASMLKRGETLKKGTGVAIQNAASEFKKAPHGRARAGHIDIGVAQGSPFVGLFLKPHPTKDKKRIHQVPIPPSSMKALQKAGVNATTMRFPLHEAYIEKKTSKKFEKSAKKHLQNNLKALSNEFSVPGGKALSDGNAKKVVEQSNFSGALGSAFEGWVAAQTENFNRDTAGQWDFPQLGAQRTAFEKMFGKIPGSKGRQLGDTKVTFRGPGKFAKKVANFAATPEGRSMIKAVGEGTALAGSPTSGFGAFGRSGSTPGVSVGKRLHPKMMARGGSVDSVPALLTPGEFVINKDSASKIGLGNLNKMNQGQMPAFASGGLVTPNRARYGTRMSPEMISQIGMGAMFAGPMLQQAVGPGALGGGLGGAAMMGGTAAMMLPGINALQLGLVAAAGAISGFVKGLHETERAFHASEIEKASQSVEKAFAGLSAGTDAAMKRYEMALSKAVKALQASEEFERGTGQTQRRFGSAAGLVTGTWAELGMLGKSDDEKTARRTIQAELGTVTLLSTFFKKQEGREKVLNQANAKVAERTAQAASRIGQTAQQEVAQQFQGMSLEELKVQRTGAGFDKMMSTKKGQERFDAIFKANAEAQKELADIQTAGFDSATELAEVENLKLRVYLQSIKPAAELVISQKEMALVARSMRKDIDKLAGAFEGIRGVIARVDDAMNNLSMTMMSNIRSSQGVAELNVPKNQIQNITGNLRAFSTKERRTAFGEMARATGARRGGALHKAVQVRELGFTLEKALPGIINKAKMRDTGDQMGFIGKQIRALGGTGKTDTARQFLDAAAKSVELLLSGGGNRQAGGLDELAADPKKIRQLVPASEDAAKTLQAFAKAVDAQRERTAKLTNEYTKLILASREAVRKVAEIGLERKAAFAEVSGRQQTVDELFEPFNQRIRSLSGGQVFGSQTQDVHILEKRRVALEAERRIIQDRMNTFGKSKAETARLTARFALISSALAENHKALQLFATDTTRAAAILGKLKDIDRRRAGARDFLGGLMTAGPDELRDRTMGMNLLGGVMSGAANVNQFTPDQNRLMLAALEDMKRLANLQGDTKTGRAAIKRLEDLEAKIFGQAFGPALGLLKGRGGPGDLLMGGLIGRAATPKRGSPEEKDLIKRLGETFDTKKGGAEALARLAIGAHREFGKDLANQGVVFAAAFETAFSNMNKEGFMINALPDVMLKGTTVPLEVIPRGRSSSAKSSNAGGRIPGTGTSDTVPAMLTPGEFVVNASSAQANLGLLHSINKGGVQRFNEGGEVRDVRDRFRLGLEQYIAGQIAPYDTDAEAKAAGLKAWPLGDYGFKVGRKLIEPDLAFQRILPSLMELNSMGTIQYGSDMGFHKADSSPGTGHVRAADTKKELSKAASHSAAARYLKGFILPQLNDASALGIWMHGDDARKSMLFEGMTKQSIFPKGVEAALAKAGEFHLTGASSLLPDENVVDFTSVAQQAHSNLRSSIELLIGENIQKLEQTKQLTEKNIYFAFARAANASGSNLSLGWEKAFVSKSTVQQMGGGSQELDSLIGRGEIDRIFVEKLLNGGGEPTGLATKYFGSDATKNSMRDARHTLVKILASQQEKSQFAHAQAASGGALSWSGITSVKEFQKQSKDIFNLMNQAVSTDQLRKIHAEHAESEKTDALLRDKFPVNLLDPMTQAIIDARTGGYWRYMDTQQIHQELAKATSLSAKEVVGGLNYYPTSEQFKTGISDTGQMNPDVQAERMLKSLTVRKYLDEARHFDPEVGRILTQTTGAQLGPGKQRRGIRNFTAGDIISAETLTAGEKLLLAGGFGAQMIPRAMGQSVMSGLKTMTGHAGAMGAVALPEWAGGGINIEQAIDDDVISAASDNFGNWAKPAARFAGARLGGLHESAVGVAQTAGALVDAVQNVVGKGQFEGVGQSLKVAAISGKRVLEGIKQVAGGRAGAAAENAKQSLAKAGVSKHLIRDFETAGGMAATLAELLAPHGGQIARRTIEGGKTVAKSTKAVARTATAPISEVAAQFTGAELRAARARITKQPNKFLDDLGAKHRQGSGPTARNAEKMIASRSEEARKLRARLLSKEEIGIDSFLRNQPQSPAKVQQARAELLQPLDTPIGPGQAATAPRFMTRPRALPKPETPHLLRHTEAVLKAVGPPRDLHFGTAGSSYSSVARPMVRPKTPARRLSDQALDAQIRAAERVPQIKSKTEFSLAEQTQLGMDLTLAPLTKRTPATIPTVGSGTGVTKTAASIKAAKKLDRHGRRVQARRAGQAAKSQEGLTTAGQQMPPSKTNFQKSLEKRGLRASVYEQMTASEKAFLHRKILSKHRAEGVREKWMQNTISRLNTKVPLTDAEVVAAIKSGPTAAAKPKLTTKPTDVRTAYQEEVARLGQMSDTELNKIADTELAALGVEAEAAAAAKPTTTAGKSSEQRRIAVNQKIKQNIENLKTRRPKGFEGLRRGASKKIKEIDEKIRQQKTILKRREKRGTGPVTPSRRVRRLNRKNAGGRIPGTGTSDTVPAMLTPGEFVINASATQANLGLLQAINNRGAVQRFADGGLVETDPDTGLWKATGGARLNRAQIMENRRIRGELKRGRIWERQQAMERSGFDPGPQETVGFMARDAAPKPKSKPAGTGLPTSDEVIAGIAAHKPSLGHFKSGAVDPAAAAGASSAAKAKKSKEQQENRAKAETKTAREYLASHAEVPFPDRGPTSPLTDSHSTEWMHRGDIMTHHMGIDWINDINEKMEKRMGRSVQIDSPKGIREIWEYFLPMGPRNKVSREAFAEQALSASWTNRPYTEEEIQNRRQRYRSAMNEGRAFQKQFLLANRGTLVPGTGYSDTVPAMLTPGEFVVNAAAAQKNLSLLHSINDGNVQGFNLGGHVRKRYQRGGQEGRGGLFAGRQQLADAMTAFNQTSTPALVAAMNTFSMSQQALTQALSGFESAAQQLYVAAESIGAINIPEKIVVELAPTSVGLTGESALAAALANSIGGRLGQLISEAVGGTIRTNTDGSPAGPVQ